MFERFTVVWPPEWADPHAPHPFDLAERYVNLGTGNRAAEVPAGPDSWSEIADRRDLASSRLVMVSRCEESWTQWERHPQGEELVMLLAGRARLVLEMDDGDSGHTIDLRTGEAVLIPPGIWHRLEVEQPARILAITPGRGTDRRDRGDQSSPHRGPARVTPGSSAKAPEGL